MPPKPILDPNEIPKEVVAGRDELNEANPQRFEMAQLTAITLFDKEKMIVAGYKDVREDEFWIRGHLPGFPLMPGVLMCEAAAQLCSYYCYHAGITQEDEFIGFGGMDNVRFRGAVRPGQRLWLIGRTHKHSHRRMQFEMQGYVDSTMVFNGEFIGMTIKKDSS